MSRYIIKNCPCFVEGIAIKGNEQKTQTCNNHKVRELTLCQDRTDCVIKRIVGKCMELYNMECKNRYKTNGYILAFDILKELDIEEVK